MGPAWPGLFFSLPRWALAEPAHGALVRLIQAVGIASVTFTLAAVLARSLVDYGTRVPVPVSGLSQHVVRVVVTLVGGNRTGRPIHGLSRSATSAGPLPLRADPPRHAADALRPWAPLGTAALETGVDGGRGQQPCPILR